MGFQGVDVGWHSMGSMWDGIPGGREAYPLKGLCSQIFVLAFLRFLKYSILVDLNDTKL